MPQKKKRGLYYFWPVLASMLIFLFLLLTTVLGLLTVRIGQEFSISFYGGFVILRQIWLQRASYLHNREMIEVLASPVRMVLEQQFPEKRSRIIKICSAHQPFDRLRRRLMKELDLDYAGWFQTRREQLKFFDHVVMGFAPIYGIPWKQVEAQAWSLVNQIYPLSKFWFVVNDWTDIETINGIIKLIPQLNDTAGGEVFEIYVEPTPGKRHAMFQGFNWSLVTDGKVVVIDGNNIALSSLFQKSDFVINSDGDTEADWDLIANLLTAANIYPDVDVFTGDVRVSNFRTNLLTRYTGSRYSVAFWKERAAQSWSRKYIPSRGEEIRGQMVCPSGPFLAMRSAFAAEFLDEWYTQRFMGKECTFGDDRHWGTLALINGRGSMFVNGCIVWTDAPTKIPQWTRQQYRWGQSGYRENWWIVANNGLPNLTWLVRFDLFYLTFFPFLIAGAVLAVVHTALGAFWSHLGAEATAAFQTMTPLLALAVGFLVVFSEILNFAKLGMHFKGSDIARYLAPRWDKVSPWFNMVTVVSFVFGLYLAGLNFSDPTLWEGLKAFWDVLWSYLRIVLVLQFIFQSLYGWLVTGDPFFLLWPGYNYLYFRYLAKQKITTLIGLRITAWGTRSAAEIKQGEGA